MAITPSLKASSRPLPMRAECTTANPAAPCAGATRPAAVARRYCVRRNAMTSAASSGVMRKRGIGARAWPPLRLMAPSVSSRRRLDVGVAGQAGDARHLQRPVGRPRHLHRQRAAVEARFGDDDAGLIAGRVALAAHRHALHEVATARDVAAQGAGAAAGTPSRCWAEADSRRQPGAARRRDHSHAHRRLDPRTHTSHVASSGSRRRPPLHITPGLEADVQKIVCRGRRPGRLVVEPVAELHEEDVARGRREQAAEVAAEAEVALVAVLLAALLPDDEQRRARPVFPAQHVGRAERAVVEVGIAGVGVGLEAVGVGGGAAVRELAEALIAPGRHERLGVALERQRRRHGVVGAQRHRHGALLEPPEHVVRARRRRLRRSRPTARRRRCG